MLNLKKKGLSRQAVRRAFEADLDSGGLAIKRAILFADGLMERTPGTWTCAGRRILCGMRAEEYVVEGLRRMLAGEHCVHGFLGGLLTGVRDLILGARSRAGDDELLREVRTRFQLRVRNPLTATLTTVFEDAVTASVASALLKGMTPIEVAQGMDRPLRDVLVRTKRIQRVLAGLR